MVENWCEQGGQKLILDTLSVNDRSFIEHKDSNIFMNLAFIVWIQCHVSSKLRTNKGVPR